MAACLQAAAPADGRAALVAHHGLEALVASFVGSRSWRALLLLPPDQPGRWSARLQAAGVRAVIGRAKDVVLRGGHTVFSVEVEQVLAAADAVEAAAVVGVPDQVGGEAVAALVVLHAGAVLDVADLRARVGAAIGPHAVPRRVQAVVSLPRNATGKIDKDAVRTLLDRGIGRTSP